MDAEANAEPLPESAPQAAGPRAGMNLGLVGGFCVALALALGWGVVEHSGKSRAQAGYADLQKEIESQKTARKEGDANAQALLEKLNAAETLAQNQTAAAKALESKCAAQAEDNRKLQETLGAEQNKQKNLRDEHQQALASAQASAQAKVEDLNKKAEAEHALAVKKSSEAKDQAGQLEDLNKDLKAAQSDNVRLKLSAAEAEAQLKKAQDLGKSQDKLLRAKDAEIAGLQTQLQKGAQDFDRFKNDYDKLKADRDKLSQENKKQDDQIRDLRNELARARKK